MTTALDTRHAEWRQAGAILLLSCYELGRRPLGITSPAAFLERAGFAPTLLDLAREDLDEDAVAAARVVGISVPMHTALRLGVAALRRVRALNPSCHIAFLGLYAGMNRDHLLELGADACLSGELEDALVALVEGLEAGRPASPPVAPIQAKLAFPSRSRANDLPPLDQYAVLLRDGRQVLAGAVETTRGCKHLCRHCPIPPVYEGRFFAVPRAVVLEQIDRLVAEGAGHITFADPDFLNGPTHALKIARALHAAHPQLTFDFTAKVSHLVTHADAVDELGRLGALFVVSAVESLSDAVLTRLAKGHTRADVQEALAITRAAGIAIRPSLVAFTPWTTLVDTLELLEFVEREGLIDHVDPIQYSIRLLVPPGSLLAEHAELGELDAPNFTYRWDHPDPRMDALQRAVAARVEADAQAEVAPRTTFRRVRELVQAARDGRPPRAIEAVPGDAARPVPRLTESWFC